MANKPPLVAIVGPTATGKSEISIELADEFHGEIVSADSRQVYRGMDIGTGKVLPEQQSRVPHHLLDMVEPTEQFTLAQFQEAALAAIKHIQDRGRLPFLVGGTGLYVQAVVDNLWIPPVPPQQQLRAQLAKLSLAKLQERLKAVDPVGYQTIDQQNPRRLIRAIEVSETTGTPFSKLRSAGPAQFELLMIGVRKTHDSLQTRIESRLKERLDRGMVKEVQQLQERGVSWEQLESFGLEYRRIAEYLQGKYPYETAVQRLEVDIFKFAKRQMTWFRRDKRIHWVESEDEAEQIVSDWLAERTLSFA